VRKDDNIAYDAYMSQSFAAVLRDDSGLTPTNGMILSMINALSRHGKPGMHKI
jgi:hypothetical protein